MWCVLSVCWVMLNHFYSRQIDLACHSFASVAPRVSMLLNLSSHAVSLTSRDHNTISSNPSVLAPTADELPEG